MNIARLTVESAFQAAGSNLARLVEARLQFQLANRYVYAGVRASCRTRTQERFSMYQPGKLCPWSCGENNCENKHNKVKDLTGIASPTELCFR